MPGAGHSQIQVAAVGSLVAEGCLDTVAAAAVIVAVVVLLKIKGAGRSSCPS